MLFQNKIKFVTLFLNSEKRNEIIFFEVKHRNHEKIITN